MKLAHVWIFPEGQLQRWEVTLKDRVKTKEITYSWYFSSNVMIIFMSVINSKRGRWNYSWELYCNHLLSSRCPLFNLFKLYRCYVYFYRSMHSPKVYEKISGTFEERRKEYWRGPKNTFPNYHVWLDHAKSSKSKRLADHYKRDSSHSGRR